MWRDLLEDLRRYPGKGCSRVRLAAQSQGFWAVAAYRAGRQIHRLPALVRVPVLAAFKPVALVIECATGIQLPPAARIGPGLYIGHFGGVIVSSRAVLGRRCNLSQGVTIGEGGRGERQGVPVLGDRIYVGPGAKIFGAVHIGDDAAIGANAVVNVDVPAGVTVAGVPARVVSRRGSHGLIEVGRPAPLASVQPGVA